MGRSGRHAVLSTVALATFALAAAPLRAGSLNVPGDSPTIQGAIVLAANGDTILVAPGTYVETIDFLGKQLVIESTDSAVVTTIDAGGRGRPVTVDSAEPAGTRLAGFTITGGTGAIVALPVGQGTLQDTSCGGGLYVGAGAHLELADCVVSGNAVGGTPIALGGGMAAHQSIVTVTGCTFSDNTAETGAAFSIPNGLTQIAISNCLFTGNTATSSSAVNLWDGTGTVTDCDFLDNVGTGLHKSGYGVTVTRCTFQGNTGWGYSHFASLGADVKDLTFLGNGLGGAYCVGAFFGAEDIISGSRFVNDTLRMTNTVGTIDRCTFDHASIDIHSGSSAAGMTNSIVRGAGSIIGAGAFSATYSDIEGGLAGTGNIDTDPLWVDAINDDYALLPASPCIDAGKPTSPLDPDGTRADMGAIPFENAFDDLAGGVAGSAGVVALAAHSTLLGGEGVYFKLTGTPPLQPVVLILGATQLGAPFKGGTLWPNPSVLINLFTNGAGQLTLSTTWPSLIPPGFKLFAQYWYPDAGAVAGFAGSNGVRGTVP